MIRSFLSLIVIFLLVACVPVAAVQPTTVDVELSITPVIHPSATLKPTPNSTATLAPRPFLISLTTYTDGGDELYTCFYGFNQPAFILYEDGELIIFEDGYKQATLSQSEIDGLMQHVADTGLQERPQGLYQGGFNELVVNGAKYYPDYSASSTDPAQRAWEILENYQSAELTPYIPPKLYLVIYRISDTEFIQAFTQGQPPKFEDWQGTLFSSYDIGWHEVTGGNVSVVMQHFENFPDFRLFRDGEQDYIAAICANFE